MVEAQMINMPGNGVMVIMLHSHWLLNINSNQKASRINNLLFGLTISLVFSLCPSENSAKHLTPCKQSWLSTLSHIHHPYVPPPIKRATPLHPFASALPGLFLPSSFFRQY